MVSSSRENGGEERGSNVWKEVRARVSLEKALDVLSVVGFVEDDLLDVVAHGLLDVLVDGHGAGVDDAHGHAVLDGVVEEDGVDRLAQRREAAEAEGQVGHAARDLGAGQVGRDPVRRLDEVLSTEGSEKGGTVRGRGWCRRVGGQRRQDTAVSD
eukprot:4431813-Pleurochrysis_carterae.AAC.1